MANDLPLALARLVLGRPDASVAGVLDHLSALVERARIPGFAAAGLVEADLPALADQSLLSGSTKGNPVPVTREDVIGLLRLAM
jgi:alcohol dehydrogenase class IV